MLPVQLVQPVLPVQPVQPVLESQTSKSSQTEFMLGNDFLHAELLSCEDQ